MNPRQVAYILIQGVDICFGIPDEEWRLHRRHMTPGSNWSALRVEVPVTHVWKLVFPVFACPC